MAVVNQEIVGHPGKPGKRIVIVNGNGFFAHVSAGHHQGCKSMIQQQIMQWGIGKHHPDGDIPGRYCIGEQEWLFFIKQHNRTSK